MAELKKSFRGPRHFAKRGQKGENIRMKTTFPGKFSPTFAHSENYLNGIQIISLLHLIQKMFKCIDGKKWMQNRRE